MRAFAAGLIVSCLAPVLAWAQDSQPLCHHAGLSYSPGSMIRMGQSLQRCAITEDGISVWTAVLSEEDRIDSANCVSGGREFGHGSIIPAGGVDLTCSRGFWFVKKD